MDTQRNKDWHMVSGAMIFLERDDYGRTFKKQYNISPDEVGVVKAQIKENYNRIMRMEFTDGCGDENCSWCTFVRRVNGGES